MTHKKSRKMMLPFSIAIGEKPSALDFRKAHEAIFIRTISGRLSLLKRKGYNVLLKNAQDQGVDRDYFSIQLSRFVKLLEYDSNDYEIIKDLGRAYVSTHVEWGALSNQGKSMRWGVAALLSSFEINNDIIEYSFDRKIKQRLLDPEIYYRMNLRLQSVFRSSYALILYEVCGRYLTNPSRVTPCRPWTEWRAIFCGNEDSIYDQFKYFNSRVLKRAIEEVNAVSDIVVEMMVFRKGKYVSNLQFKVAHRAQQNIGIKDDDAKTRAAHARCYFNELSDSKQATLLTEFGNIIKNNNTMYELFKKRGLRNKIISGSFFSWLADHTSNQMV